MPDRDRSRIRYRHLPLRFTARECEALFLAVRRINAEDVPDELVASDGWKTHDQLEAISKAFHSAVDKLRLVVERNR